MTKTAGSIRFNTDSAKMEIYNGEAWWEIDSTSPEEQTGGTRLLFGGGYGNSPHPAMDSIDFMNIATTGNASDFGNMTTARTAKSGGSSRTRGLFQGGRFSPTSDGYNTIDFVTISSIGNAQDFGDLTGETRNPGKQGLSDRTRSIFGGGYSMPEQTEVNSMEYVTIASTGNGVNFGDLLYRATYGFAGGSSTRGVLSGGYTPSSPNQTEVIEFIEIATTGNGTDFGDGVQTNSGRAGASSGHGGL